MVKNRGILQAKYTVSTMQMLAVARFFKENQYMDKKKKDGIICLDEKLNPDNDRIHQMVRMTRGTNHK